MLTRALQTTRGRLVVLLGAVAVVLIGSAALAHFAFDEYGTFGDALWNALVHLLDPSTLQDDEGAAARAIGVFQVVAGLVLLVGLLFTFVAETVGRSLERLGQSDRPVRARDHLLVIGGADMAPFATRAAAEATRLRPAFERIVVLAPESARQSRDQLRADLEDAAGDLRLDLVFGDTAGESGFELAAVEHAAAILSTPTRSGPVAPETADVETARSGLALRRYLDERGAKPRVCLLFRRGRNVDAAWELLPDTWNAVVGDRTVTGLLRLALTRPDALAGLPVLGESTPSARYVGLIGAAWRRAAAEKRRLRLAIVGCNFDAPALMEDLAEAGAERFDVSLIAGRDVFERYLGAGAHSGVEVRFVETRVEEPERLAASLAGASPDIVLVSPSPRDDDLRTSDAAALLTLLRIRHAVDEETPIVAELFLPVEARGVGSDPRLLILSGLRTVTEAIALTVFDPSAAASLKERLSADAVEAAGH